LALLVPALTLAYNFKNKPPIKWGKVNQSELELETVDFEPDAPAVVLCDFGTIEISNRTFYNRHVRIKILKPEGKKFATVEIPYQFKNKYDDVLMLKAQVIQQDKDGRIQEIPVPYKEISDLQIDDYHAIKRFTFPNVKPGSIIEYTYEIASMDFVKLNDWEFQNNIPTLWSEVRMEVPEPFIYLLTYQKGPELKENEKIAFALALEKLKHSKWKRAKRDLFEKNDVLFKSEKKNYVVHVVNEKRKKIIHRSLPSLSNEKHEQVALNRAPRIRFHLLRSEGILPPFYKPLLLTVQEGFEDMSRNEIEHEMQPAGYVHYQLENWSQMNNRYLNSEQFGRVLMKHFNHIPVFNEVLEDNMSDLEKATALTEYVRSHVMWNGVYDSKVKRNLNTVLKKNYGNSAEINFMLLYLLNRADIEAWPVLAKTVDQGRVEEVYPVRDQFNHTLILVNVGEEQLVMDLTISDKKRAFPVNPEGWIVRKNNYGWINIVEPQIKVPENNNFTAQYKLDK
jgi:hypothetical protein